MEEKHKAKNPTESHKTAAWANKESVKPISNVAKPNPIQTENAKDYVDENQK